MANRTKAETGTVQFRRVDIWFSQEQYNQLLQLRSMREEGNGKTVAVNQLVRDLVDKAYAEKVEETLKSAGT